MTRLVGWVRRRILAGLFVAVPLVISVATVVWIVRAIDRVTAPIYARWLPYQIPGLGLLTTVVGLLLVGVLATNVIGRRLWQRLEAYLLKVPFFRTIYAPVKQLVAAFSPDSEQGFKRVAMADDPARGLVLGFVTREFTVDRGEGPEPMVAMYVPTNHLYLGDVRVYPRCRVSFPDLTIEDAVRVFLTGGMALDSEVRARRAQEPGRPGAGSGQAGGGRRREP